jgi:teichuronic acid biosynthesis glycosyltransferase TuaC
MRILTYTSLFPNAQQKDLGVFIYQRMAHVARRPGIQVEVVAPVPYFPTWLRLRRWEAMRKIPPRETIGGLTVYHPRYPFAPKISMPLHGLLMCLGSFFLVRRLHAQMRFDCIDAHYVYPDGFAAALLAAWLKIPLIVSARGTDINLFPSFRLIRPMIRWTLRNTAGAVGVCGALRDAMVELGAPRQKTQVIGNGVDVSRFQPLDRDEARGRLGMARDAEIIVSVGALIPRKAHHLAISAIAQVARQHPKVQLYIVGAGESRQELETMARRLGIDDRIFLVGSRPNEDLSTWYSAANVSCLVSSREGWANILLESLACGTPVVATRVWGTPEVLVSSELGIMVDQKVEEIAQALAAALEKRWDRALLVDYARKRNWDVVASEVEEFLRLKAYNSPDGTLLQEIEETPAK